MRVVMEFTIGPMLGRRFHLTRNQRLVVGSTSQADVVIRGDNTLAARHLAMETDRDVCRLVDLSGQAATLLNGQSVQSAVLRTGDVVQAGRSQFKVLVEGDDAAAIPAERIVTAAAARKAGSKERAGVYDAMVCDTGLIRIESSCSEFPPAELAASLAAEYPLYLLVDNRRAGIESLSALANPNYLFDWLGDGARNMSPMILKPQDAPSAETIAQAWQKDALVCFFAANENVNVVQELRRSARVSDDRVMGICWPTVLAYLLSHYQPDAVSRLMAPFRCILLEDPQVPDHWLLYAHESMEECLTAYGLQAAAPTSQV